MLKRLFLGIYGAFKEVECVESSLEAQSKLVIGVINKFMYLYEVWNYEIIICNFKF